MGDIEIQPGDLEAKIIECLPADYCKAIDESDGCGGKFVITVVSRYVYQYIPSFNTMFRLIYLFTTLFSCTLVHSSGNH